MVMDTLQIRMNKELLKRIDSLVRTGVYSNRSDVIRDAVRRFVWEKEVGSVKNNNKNSVKEVKDIRKKLSKEPICIKEINNFGKL
jgi:Arc/MetJ-type ribon-helix-helix transcriptional regulator